MVNSILKTELELKVLEKVESVIGPMGLRVVDIDCRAGGRSLIRLFIERTPKESLGEQRSEQKSENDLVSLENCAEASRRIGAAFEAAELQAGVAGWFPGAYDLEVSSPGLERRLRLQSDFDRFVGKEVKLKLNERLLPRGANVTGTLLKTVPGEVILKIDNDEVAVRLKQIKQANLVWRDNAN